MSWRKNIVKICLRYDRGKSWYSRFNDILQIVILIGVWGISPSYLLPVAIIMIIGFLITGTIDFKRGTWKEEQRYSVMELNPALKEMKEKIDTLYEGYKGQQPLETQIKRLEKAINDIKFENWKRNYS